METFSSTVSPDTAAPFDVEGNVVPSSQKRKYLDVPWNLPEISVREPSWTEGRENPFSGLQERRKGKSPASKHSRENFSGSL